MSVVDRFMSAVEAAGFAYVRDLVPTGQGGTMRDWFSARDGRQVETVQLGYGGRVWAPGAREIDASRATYVSMDGSRRDYKGMTVVASSPAALLVESRDGQVILYWEVAA